MKYVISNTGEPFQFAISRDVVYSFDTLEPIAVSDDHFGFIVSRIGSLCLKEVDAPAEAAPLASAETETAPAEAAPLASAEAPVVEPETSQE